MTKRHTKWMNHWIDVVVVVVVTLTIHVVSDRLHKVNASSAADGGYVNPCNAFGTADKLNALYRGLGPDDSCSGGGPSFKCSGVIIRSGLGRENVTYQGKGGIADDPNIFNIEDPIYSIGVETLTSAVCPSDIVDGAEYPGFCPDPGHIYKGSISFSYIRQDLAPPISLLKEWEETGVNPITGMSKELDMGMSVAYPGGGYILFPEDVYDANPDVVLPDSDGQPSSFWKFDRVGNFWPMDGHSYGRTFCGNGPSWGDMYLGIDGPIVPPGNILYGANACPHDSAGWENLAIPENYTGSCPASVAESVESYYAHWFSSVDKAFDGINCSASEHKEIGYDVCNLFVGEMQMSPQQLACGLAPEYFDQTMVPLTKTMPLKVILEHLQNCNNTQNGTPCDFGFGLWNEVTIKSWNGIGLSDLAAHLVVWYDDTDGSKDLAYTRAKEFYDASGVNGGQNIRIPVVYRNNSKLFDDPDDVDSDVVFSCPVENSSDTDSVEEGNLLSSSGPFIFINLSLIVSFFVVFAI